MSKYRAAILTGPRGEFAVLELTEAQRRRLSADDRQAVAECFKSRHHNMPVVFVTASPSTAHAIHGQELTEDLERCLTEQAGRGMPWTHFDYRPSGEVAT